MHSVQARGAHHRLERVGGQVMAVGDQADTQAIVRELCPYVVGVARQRRVRPVAEMRGHGGARRDGLMYLVAGGMRMTDSDADAQPGYGADERVAARPVGGDGDHADQPAARPLPLLHLGGVGWPDVARVVSAARTFLVRQERPFDMDIRDRVREVFRGPPGGRDRRQRRQQLILRRGDQGGHDCGHADRLERVDEPGDGLRP